MAYSSSPLAERGARPSSSVSLDRAEAAAAELLVSRAEASAASEPVEGGAVGSGGEARSCGARGASRSRRPRARVSVMAHHRVWLPPFAAEAAMLSAAGWLSFFLYRTVWAPEIGLPLWPGVGMALAYVALALHSRAHELFLPRPVVLVGVGALALAAAGGVAAFCADAWLTGGRRRLLYTPFVVVPLLMYLGRCGLLFLDARFAPSLSALPAKQAARSERWRVWRRKLDFWLN